MSTTPTMRVLVTGGTGAVGINVTRRLAADGHEVVCLSRRANEADALRDRFLRPVSARVRLVQGDVTSFARLREIFVETSPTHVVHAAAITPTPEMERAMTRKIIDVNLVGTANVLEASRLTGVRRLAYISSAAIYGETDEAVPISEEFPIHPQGLYAVAKDASEKLCGAYQAIHDLEAVSMRVGWVYGPMERPMQDSRHTMSLVYQVVRLALAATPVRLVHLDHVRDWIYADDLAQAVLVVLGQDRLQAPVYNLSGGVGYTHRELLETLRRIVPLEYQQVTDPAVANVPPQITRRRRGPASTARLLAHTAYRPRFTLEEGLRDYVRWVRAEGRDADAPGPSRHAGSGGAS